MIQKFKNLYSQLFTDYVDALNTAIGGCRTLLDVGCGFPSPVARFSSRLDSTGVDIYLPSIEQSRAMGIHNNYEQIDVLKIGKRFAPNSFECVLASDVIEHLPKESGYGLLEQMERIASKRVIIFTPNGFLPQAGHSGNPWQEHKSGWIPEDMEALGYRAIGINGWKPLRGEFAYIKYRPRMFWHIVSDLSQLVVRHYPKHAFQILCVKEKVVARL